MELRKENVCYLRVLQRKSTPSKLKIAKIDCNNIKAYYSMNVMRLHMMTYY